MYRCIFSSVFSLFREKFKNGRSWIQLLFMFFFVVYDHLLKILKEKKTTISISGLKKSFSHGLRDCGMISIQLLLCLVFCKFNLNSQTVDMKLELSDDCVLLEDVFFFYRLHTFFFRLLAVGWLIHKSVFRAIIVHLVMGLLLCSL